MEDNNNVQYGDIDGFIRWCCRELKAIKATPEGRAWLEAEKEKCRAEGLIK